jgi:hypothetical protein
MTKIPDAMIERAAKAVLGHNTSRNSGKTRY